MVAHEMKILLSSHAFAPSVGGIETASALLADEFRRAGYSVTIVTQTPDPDEDPPAGIVRKPGARKLWALVRDCDVVFHNNVSLQTAWPMLAIRRPWIVAHQTWLRETAIRDRLKLRCLSRARNVAISRAVAATLPWPVDVIPNPYRASIFREQPGIARDRDLMFLGRLVSDKGADLLIAALGMMKRNGLVLRLTITGDGPDKAALQAQATEAGVRDQVEFTGPMQGADLAARLNRHRILVVPSRWPEPFGIVALEGIACGCVVVGTQGGGLPDAIGPRGLTVANNSAEALAEALGTLSRDSRHVARLRDAAPAHLARHRPETVARQYLAIFEAERSRHPGGKARNA